MYRVSGVIGGCAGFADHDVEDLSLRRSANKSKFPKLNLIGSMRSSHLNVKTVRVTNKTPKQSLPSIYTGL